MMSSVNIYEIRYDASWNVNYCLLFNGLIKSFAVRVTDVSRRYWRRYLHNRLILFILSVYVTRKLLFIYRLRLIVSSKKNLVIMTEHSEFLSISILRKIRMRTTYIYSSVQNVQNIFIYADKITSHHFIEVNYPMLLFVALLMNCQRFVTINRLLFSGILSGTSYHVLIMTFSS